LTHHREWELVTTTSPESPPGVAVRPVQEIDLIGVSHIEKLSFPQPWPYDAFRRFLDAPAFLVADDGDHVIGYVVADRIPNHGEDLGHVKDLAVHPQRRGEGIGRLLLSTAVERLRGEDVVSVKLEVRESNDAAQSLYRSFDFEPLRRVPRYYDDGEDAVVMLLDLTSEP
jgi:ribosomal-protein-alanine N-acetyltransferase